jgi:hypothetical protein
VEAASLAYPRQGTIRPMGAMMGVGRVYAFLLEGLIFLRPGLKLVLVLGAIFLTALVLMVLFKHLSRYLDSFEPRKENL